MNTYRKLNSVNILLVEDNPGDIRLAQEAFRDENLSENLNVVTDGEDAIYFLKKKGKYMSAATPSIILLDLNLPKKNGNEVLDEIKNDPVLMCIPVIVFTSSESDIDIFNTYSRHANCYISKPTGFDEYVSVIKSIKSFWFNIAKLPAIVIGSGITSHLSAVA